MEVAIRLKAYEALKDWFTWDEVIFPGDNLSCRKMGRDSGKGRGVGESL